MKKEVFGISRKEVLAFALLLFASFFLIIFCTAKLIHKYYSQNKQEYTTIKKHTTDLILLNDINLQTLTIQRNSLNLLYIPDTLEINKTRKTIYAHRDSLLVRLNELDKVNSLEKATINNIKKEGFNYLSINNIFLISIIKVRSKEQGNDFNLYQMRPAVQTFNDLNLISRKNIIAQIQSSTNVGLNLFVQFEFWLLIIGLMPYLYVFYRVLLVIARMLAWEFLF